MAVQPITAFGSMVPSPPSSHMPRMHSFGKTMTVRALDGVAPDDFKWSTRQVHLPLGHPKRKGGVPPPPKEEEGGEKEEEGKRPLPKKKHKDKTGSDGGRDGLSFKQKWTPATIDCRPQAIAAITLKNNKLNEDAELRAVFDELDAPSGDGLIDQARWHTMRLEFSATLCQKALTFPFKPPEKFCRYLPTHV
jgi:hypothetical protein